jgi:hypothetical protein
MRESPLSSAAWLTSFMTTGIPAALMVWVISLPIAPAPITPAFLMFTFSLG